MKKTYCDCCGEEMSYDDPLLKAVNKTETVEVDGQVGKLTYRVKFILDPVCVNGVHVDTCGACAHYIFNKLDPRPKSAVDL